MSTGSDGLLASKPSLCTAHHSILQQERLYLLQALANEEGRRERLNLTIRKIEGALNTTYQGEQTRALQRNLRNLQSKLNRCERTGLALCNNLDALVAQMQRLDDHQWRRAHHDYTQQTQHGLMTSLSPTNSNWPMVSPSATPSMQPFCTLPQTQSVYYQRPAQVLYNPIDNAQISQVPPTPILRPLPYANPDAFSFPSRQGVLTNISSDEEYHHGISPTDTVSTYSLNPWVAPSQNTFSTTFVPSTQVFDLVQGLGSMAISGSENQNPGDIWVRGTQHAAPMGSSVSHHRQMRERYSARSKRQRRAGKRRSA